MVVHGERVDATRERPPPRRRAAWLAAAILVALGVGLVVMPRDDEATGAPRFASSLPTDLCELRRAAGGGSADAARVAFVNLVHEPLHQLGRALGDDHRDQVARLLEAKQTVEAKLTQGVALDVGRDLDPLISETARSLALIGIQTEPSCTGQAR